VYEICKDLCIYKEKKTIEYQMLLTRVLARGFTENNLLLMLKQYELMNVLMRTEQDGKEAIILVE
jgi:hypothetical protein